MNLLILYITIFMKELLNKLADNQTIELNNWVEATRAYYTDEAIMSDPEFDELQEKLLSYNIPELTHFINSGIFKVDRIEEVAEYTQEMISLFKIKYKNKSNVSEIKKFLADAINNKINLYYAPKLDGSALKITWNFTENIEIIESIISRGGLDVTNHFKNHPDIIATKKYRKKIIAGELVINKQLFMDKYSDEWENPRNFVGKFLKQKTIEKEIIDDLKFIPCTDGINHLNDIWNQCNINHLYKLEEIVQLYKSDNFPYLCDGIVIAYDTETRIVKDNYPLNMVAIKFPGARAKTKVIGFEWTQKKSGKLTPKILIESTKLDGSTITCANGYNYQNVIDNNIGIGSLIEIEKSGDIIPVVVKVITYSKIITLPQCEYIKAGKHLIAQNLEESRKYKFILGLKLLNIDGIGDTLAEKIGQIVHYEIVDVFNPRYKADICEILGGGSNWQKFKEVYNIKNIYLDNLINLLQFNNVGPAISKKIALLILKKSNDTSNISSDILTNVCKGEGFIRIKNSLEYLKIHGIKVLPPYEINDDTVTFEMTGNPPKMTKEEFVKRIKVTYPNSIHESLTKNTKYLVCDDLNSNSGKINKARKYNIKIVTYTDVLTKGF